MSALATSASGSATGSLLASLLSDDSFRPSQPKVLEETGLTTTQVEALLLKYLMLIGSSSGRQLADKVCLPFMLLEGLLHSMRQRQLLVHAGSAQLGDYVYALTEQGRNLARSAMDASAYIGPAPVPLDDYIVSVEAQTIRAESPKRKQLQAAFADINIEQDMLELLGPAVNSGAGMFLYGAPGNGKTTVAKRITACYGQSIWIPRTLTEDGQFIKFYDAAYHEPIQLAATTLLKTDEFDQRWIKIKRPTVVVGGELTMDNLEMRHDMRSNISEAPIQLKSNCGCLLIDDFGRQRMSPTELLNRWIVPLENRIDYQTLATGKKIQVPFEQLIIFSTNLEPNQLADDAFLRRIPYKIEIKDPDLPEFSKLFGLVAKALRFPFRPEAVEHLVSRHYEPNGRPLRRCQPRDLLNQVKNYCTYNSLPLEMKPEYFDRVVPGYFTVVSGKN